MIPARPRANRHNQAKLAWLVAMSPSPAATLSRIGGAALVDLDCTCAFALPSSVAQLHFPIRSPLWYLGKQATDDLFVPSKPPLQAPGLHLLCAFMPSILRLLHYDASSPSSPSSQKLANGERNLQTNSIATRKRTWVVPRYPRAHYSIWPVNREGYAVHERQENACLTRAILPCYKVLALYQL